ncbi:MAG: DUF4920 domain-containing protein [Planctomycetota bacterium]|jgi:hypothetical protein
MQRLALGLAALALLACSAEVEVKPLAPPSTTPSTDVDESKTVETPEQPPAGTVYGEPIGEAPLVTLTDLVADPDKFEGQRVRVSGMVTDVCAKRGCWMNIGAEEGPEQVQFKVVDGVIVIPMKAKGGWTEAEGTVKKLAYTLEQTIKFMEHKAEEAGEEFDPASVTEPMTMVRLSGIGAVIRDKK